MIKDFLDGFSSYGKALNLVSELRLWKYILAPGLISVLIGCLILFSAWNLSDNIGNLLTGWYPWDFGSGVVEKVGSVFGGILVLALGLVIFKHLVMVLSGPFMSPLSEAIESHMRGRNVSPKFSPTRMAREIVRGLRIAIRNLIRELFYTLVLLILGLIPIFSPFVVVGIFLVQAYYFGFGNMDFALERHFGVRGSVRFVRKYKGLALGNGTVTMLVLMTLIGFLFILPMGTIAATIETVKRMEKSPSERNPKEKFV